MADTASAPTKLYKHGDKLEASTVNWLVQRCGGIAKSKHGQFSPAGDFFTDEYQIDPNLGLDTEFSPFELSTTALSSGELCSIQLLECTFHDGGQLKEEGTMDVPLDGLTSFQDLSSIWIVKDLSSGYSISTNLSAPPEDCEARMLWKFTPYVLSGDRMGIESLDCRHAPVLFGSSSSGSTISLDLSSLNWVQSSSDVSGEVVWKDTNVAQNWNYSSPEDDDKVEIEALSDLNGYRFLARPEEDGTLKYASLSSILSALSSEISGGGGGGGGCSCDLTAYLTSGTKIATWTKDGVNEVDIYAPTGGGGGDCSCEMSAIAPQFDKDWSGSQQQYWENAKVGQFKDCQGNETMLYAPNHIQISCNTYPYYTNMGNQFTFTNGVSSNIEITPDGTTLRFQCFYM